MRTSPVTGVLLLNEHYVTVFAANVNLSTPFPSQSRHRVWADEFAFVHVTSDPVVFLAFQSTFCGNLLNILFFNE